MAAILGMESRETYRPCATTQRREKSANRPTSIRRNRLSSQETQQPSSGPRNLRTSVAPSAPNCLPVSAPFHCSLMKPAQDRLEHDLNVLKMQKPVYPVACNVEAELVIDDLRARDTLLRQVTGSVKWDPCIRLLIAQGVQTFIEVGPGKVLCGLMRQIDRSKTCLNVSDDASLTKTLDALAQSPA